MEELGARWEEGPEQMEEKRCRRICGSSGSRGGRSSPKASAPSLPGSLTLSWIDFPKD